MPLAAGPLPRITGTPSMAAVTYSLRSSSGFRLMSFACAATTRSNRPAFSTVTSSALNWPLDMTIRCAPMSVSPLS